MNTRRNPAPLRSRGDYSTTVGRPAMPTHRHALPPSTPLAVVDMPYTPPPGLNHQQSALVKECESFLSPEKLNYLAAHLLRQVKGFPEFTNDEIDAVRTRAKRLGVEL